MQVIIASYYTRNQIIIIQKRQCIQNLSDKCPIDGIQCSVKLANLNISEQIDDLQIRCAYGVKLNELNVHVIDEDGCTSIMSYGKRK